MNFKKQRKITNVLFGLGLFLAVFFCVNTTQVLAADNNATVQSCKITSGGKKVTVKAKVKKKTKAMGKKLYLISYDSYENVGKTTTKKPIASVKAKKGTVKFSASLNAGKSDSRLFSKFAVAYKSGKKYRIISTAKYITNPEKLATYKSTYPKTYSKKGLQAEDPADSIALGTQHTVLNWTINSLLQDGGAGYSYKGKTYYFNYQLLDYYDELVHQYNESGSKVTVILLLQNASRKDVNSMLYKGSSANYSGVNVSSKDGCRTFEAVMTYLAERYGKKSHLVSGWILGNEIGNTKEWNYGGGKNLSAYMDNYVRAFRIVHTAAKSVNKNAHVYLSLDYHWNYDPDDEGNVYFSSRSILDTFYQKLKAQGKVNWYIAYHAYSQGLIAPEFWDDTMAENTVDSAIVNFKNLNILTDYVKKNFGSKVKVMLSEQSFSVDKGELVQAAVYAYAYYKAEANGTIEAFIYGRHIDNVNEVSAGGAMIRWGLMSNTGVRRPIWDVFQYIDSPDSLSITKHLVGYVNELSSWKKVPGFRSSKYNKMPTKRKKITGFAAVSASDTSIRLTWNKCDTASGYQIYRATSKNGKYKLIHGIPVNTQTSYTDTKLTKGKTYYYKIRMYKAIPGGGTLTGSQVEASAMVTVGQASISKALAGDDSVKLTWKSVSAADGYFVYRSLSETKGFAQVADVSGQKVTSYTDSVFAGGRYYYKVAAYVVISGKKLTGELSEVVNAVPKPSKPVITMVTPGPKRIALQWDRILSAQGYQIYSSRTKNGKYTRQKTIESGTVCSYVHDPNYTGQEYYYKVRSYVKLDGETIYSEFSDIMTATAYKKELEIAAIERDESGAAVLSWNKNEAASGYQIAKSDAVDGTYTIIGEDIKATGDAVCKFTDRNAPVSQQYYKVRIYEVNSDGSVVYGEWSKAHEVQPWEEPDTEGSEAGSETNTEGSEAGSETNTEGSEAGSETNTEGSEAGSETNTEGSETGSETDTEGSEAGSETNTEGNETGSEEL